MQDSTQAYYAAVSQVERAKHAFIYFPDDVRAPDNIKTLDPAALLAQRPGERNEREILGDRSTINRDVIVPLKFKFYEKDLAPVAFGTSKKDPTKHTLPTFGGLTFDMTGIDTEEKLIDSAEVEFKIQLGTTSTASLQVELLYEKQGSTKTFFGELDNKTGIIDLSTASDMDVTPLIL